MCLGNLSYVKPAAEKLLGTLWCPGERVTVRASFHRAGGAACETAGRGVALVLRCGADCVLPFENRFSLSVADPGAHRQSDQGLWGRRPARLGWRAVLDV